jgi:outer membrane receptor protein involved in Fe transport
MYQKYIAILLSLIFTSISINAQDIYVSTDSVAIPKINLDEVVVNASKNHSKLKDMPTSVTVIPSLIIESNGINTLSQVESLIPNFSMPDYGSKLTSPVFIRGIGSRRDSPSVGLYVDNVPYFEKAAFAFDFFDIESIEVLRGPQGTLFGRNSMGGLINITTKSPADYQGTLVKLDIGNYGTYKVNAGHYNKVNDKLSFSFSGNYQHNDGFFTNHYLNQKVDDLESYGFRNRIIYKVSSRFELENIASFESSEQGGYPYALYHKDTKILDEVNYNQASSYDRLMFSDALKLKMAGENWELSNTVSYQYIDDAQIIDQDFTVNKAAFAKQYMKQHMVANEVILQSKGDRRLTWLLGGFGFIQESDSEVDVVIYTSNSWSVRTYDRNTKGFAFFGQTTFKITDDLSITGGLRQDYEASEMAYTYDGMELGVIQPGINTIFPKMTDHVLFPKLALSYRWGKTNFYASYSTGYKPGGFNTTFELPEHLMFKKETSYNYEAGGKTSLLNNLVYVDMAVFYTKLKNQQIYRTAPSGRGSYLDNSGLSENKGVELTVRNRAVLGFEAIVAFGYTHSEILEYQLNTTVNYNHKMTPYIPLRTFACQLNKTIYIKESGFLEQIRFSLDYQQKGRVYWDLNNRIQENTYGLLNSRVSFIHKNMQLDLWGKNLTDSQYNAFLFESGSKAFAQAGKPLQFGVSASVKF